MPSVDRRALLAGSLAAIGLAALPSGARGEGARPTLNSRLRGYLDQLHDPVMIKEGEVYHVFGSGCWNRKTSPSWRTSRDLRSWRNNGTLFEELPDWVRQAVPGATCYWAPDIALVDGVFRMYYSSSTAGSMRSVIGFATSRTLDRRSPDYGWTDHGLVFETWPGGTFNAIDPNFIVDANGDHWLSFGSYWSGLKLIALDKQTGKPPPGETEIISIAARVSAMGGDENPIEAPFIYEKDGWYYLFASYDYCCRGAGSNYYVSVGRSRDVRGPYLNHQGLPMMDGHGTPVLIERPWGATRFRGPGHCGLYRDGDRDLIVYHVEDAVENSPQLRLAELQWTSDGWPVALT